MSYAILYFLVALGTFLFGLLKIDEGISLGVSPYLIYTGGALFTGVALWSIFLGVKELRTSYEN